MIASTVSWNASSPRQYESSSLTDPESRISKVHWSSAVSHASLLIGKRMSPLMVEGPSWLRNFAPPRSGRSHSTPCCGWPLWPGSSEQVVPSRRLRVPLGAMSAAQSSQIEVIHWSTAPAISSAASGSAAAVASRLIGSRDTPASADP